jgi:hypothetical protein
VPSIAAAQDVAIRAQTERLIAAGMTGLRVDPAAVDQQQPPPPPPPAQRRRPSMVGYVGDATIGSQLRIRFDAAAEITAPDRAEFFYAKCGCYRGLPSDHPAFDPDAPGPGPGIASEIDARMLMIQAEFAAGDRVSVFGELPFRWTSPQSFVPGTGTFDDASGVGDFRAGLKFGLVANADQALTIQLQVDAPTGDAGKGLGTDHWTFSPTLLFFQRVSDRVTFESQFGTVHPIDSSAGIPTDGPDRFGGTVLSYGAGAAVELNPGARVTVAPVVELFGWHVVDGFQTSTLGPADGTDILNLKLGVRLGAGPRSSIYIGYGRALTDATWYHDIFRVEYRVGF